MNTPIPYRDTAEENDFTYIVEQFWKSPHIPFNMVVKTLNRLNLHHDMWEHFMRASMLEHNIYDALEAYWRMLKLNWGYCNSDLLLQILWDVAAGYPDAKGRLRQTVLAKANRVLDLQWFYYPMEGYIFELSALIATTPYQKASNLQSAIRLWKNKLPHWAFYGESVLPMASIIREMCQWSLQAVYNHSSSESFDMIRNLMRSAYMTGVGCDILVRQYGHRSYAIQYVMRELTQILNQMRPIVWH